ncbi:putative pentatricopeptide repeat-containing protein At3g18840 [Fagus crenata]
MRSLKDGLIYHVQAIKAGFTPTIFTSNQLIHVYSKHGLLREAHKLFDEMPERNVFSWNAIISAYIKSQNLKQARALFDAASNRDLVTYNSMLSGYVSADGHEAHALKLFLDTRSAREGIKIDEFTLTTMLNLTAKLSVVSYGRQLHSYMVKSANDLSRFAVSSLIDMYSKCGCFKEACWVFSGCGSGVVDLVSKNAMVAACCKECKLEMALDIFWREPELNDTVSWNTLISGYSQNGYEEESLRMFVCMAESGIGWNEHTFASVLSACSGLKSLKLGKEVHAWVLKNEMSLNPFVSSGIVDVYCKCGNMKYAESVHIAIGNGNCYAITSMIVGYASQGNMVEARRLFDSLPEKNSVVWTALFSGYVRSQQCEVVFELLCEFYAKEATLPNAVILLSLLSSCAIQAALGPGKQIHAYLLRVGIEMDEKLITALVDMYSKCGSIAYAKKIFQRVIDRDSVIYNVMIAGYAHYGHENEAIQHFDEMVERGVRPDAVTFLALLSACRHSRLVEQGEKIFLSMRKDFNVLPETNHYACMIDLYGRTNQLEKVVAFMRMVPMEPDAAIWGAFLNACRINGNIVLAREMEEKLLSSVGDDGARYVQLANVYAAEGNWDDMGRIRKKMRREEVKNKFAGCSWVYVENGVHTFTSGDTSHFKTEDIYKSLACLTEELYEIAGASH